MKIISNKVWNEHNQLIKKLLKENKQLKRDLTDLQSFCINFAADQKAKDIDFPNSYSDHTASRPVDKLF